MINFCTLFDSNYLDKGLALYNSLDRNCSDFCLYVYCFDDKAFEILNQLNLDHATIIHYQDIESKELLAIKGTRSKAEYCWTCTPIIIEYSLEKFALSDCIYIDSDLYFYSNPQVVLNEIYSAGADVAITPHRFCNDNYGKKLEKRNGKYCVEFNFFKNNENGRKVLTWWKNKCLEWCYDIPEDDRMGDQKYLNQFPILFSNVFEIDNLGAGVAPWNLKQYSIISKDSNFIFTEKTTGNTFKLIFYHFQNIRYISKQFVNIKSQVKDKKTKYSIYIPYLREIELIRQRLYNNFGLDLKNFKIVRSSNGVISFLQKYFASLKVKNFSDIINLNKLEQYI